MKTIRMALTKGRLEEKTVEMLERLGYDCTSVREKGRKLIMPIGDVVLRLSLQKQKYRSYLCGNRCLRYGGCGERYHYGKGWYFL